MNILFLSDNFPPEHNASASRVYEQACHWVQLGHQVTVLTSAPNFPEGKLFPGYKNKFYQTEIMAGIHVIRVRTFIARNKGFFLRSIDYASYLFPAIVAGIFHKKMDIIIATCPTPFAALAGWVLSIIHKIPFVLQVSDLWPASIVAVNAMRESFLIKLLEKLELFLYRHAKKIVVLTSAFKVNLIARGISPEKIIVVLNGVNLDKYSPRSRNHDLAALYHINSEDFVAGYLGTFGMAQALENVLYAAEFLNMQPSIRFILVGTGAEREKLENIVKVRSLNNVCIIKPQPKELMPDFWSLCDIAIVHLKNSPTFSEVIPSKLFEAMGMGIPILISAPLGEATAIVRKENIGVELPPEDPIALAKTLLFYSSEKKKLAEFATNSFLAAQNYSRERQAVTTLKVLKDAVRISHDHNL